MKINLSMTQKLLVPTLKDFFAKHLLINPKVFLGDAAFDSVQLYKELLLVIPLVLISIFQKHISHLIHALI